ncbi:hypothetical protein [Bartonella raoultii]|uniref:Uncharacterized protein n=1 Tax=Bartonella raoultii TaxID=1457020 RepID=A0ABS7I4S8_9HYPH|nr:hypothetical protein [Bartonella raoultii]MBX4335267.1 hypothetical protein [Bartonella raoultii]
MEKRIRARRKAYFKRLYRKITLVFMLLFCIVVFGVLVVKIMHHFYSHKQEGPQTSVELTIPVFDMRIYCKEIAASVISDMKRDVYQRCIALESEAYFAIREMWKTLPDHVKKTCTKIVRPGDGNYFLLRDCFLSEKEDKKSKIRNYF